MKTLMPRFLRLMSIIAFVVLVLACGSTPSPPPARQTPPPQSPAPPPPGIEYWWLDVTITGFSSLAGSVQRVRFFRNLRDLEVTTGLPFDVNAQGAWRYQWLWSNNLPRCNSDSHHEIIFSVMRREGFGAAFVLSSSGISIKGQPWRIYHVYRISNGREFFAFSTTSRPAW